MTSAAKAATRRSERHVHVVSAHAEGEVGDVIIGGVDPPPGDTLWEQRNHIARDGRLRDFVLNEPRGGVFRHVNLLVPAVHPDASMGFIIMEPEFTPPMSGSNAICVATVLLECGIVPMQEPVTEFVLEAPGGLVPIRAECHAGKARNITLRNLPSFVCRRDAMISVPGHGRVRVDTAFGGDSFVIVDAGDCGFRIAPGEAGSMVRAGREIVSTANRELGFAHPHLDEWNSISFCQFASRPETEGDIVNIRSAVTVMPGKIDRSPTGTGVSALLALLHDRGRISPDQVLVARSIIGSRFTGRIHELVKCGDRSALIPEITGRAWITGTHTHLLDPDDPWPVGYRLSDTWG